LAQPVEPGTTRQQAHKLLVRQSTQLNADLVLDPPYSSTRDGGRAELIVASAAKTCSVRWIQPHPLTAELLHFRRQLEQIADDFFQRHCRSRPMGEVPGIV